MELAQPWQQSVDGEAFRLWSEGPGDHPLHGRSDRHHGEGQRQGHPAQAMTDQRRQAAPPPQHGGEEPAQQEEHRHAKAVHGKEQLLPRAVIAGRAVLHRPHSREERQRRVQPDAEQHGEGAQGVQLVPARLAARSRQLIRFRHRERLPSRAVGFRVAAGGGYGCEGVPSASYACSTGRWRYGWAAITSSSRSTPSPGPSGSA